MKKSIIFEESRNMNPFVTKGYKGAQYFCNRIEESESLVNAIRNNQDITLYGYRRLGKSALIQHVFSKLARDFVCIYTDIWGTGNIEEFTRELANGIIRSKVFSRRKFSEKMATFLKSIGASFSIGLDGLPSIDIIYQDRKHIFSNLEEIYHFLNQLNIKIVLAIDEFQEIKKYDNHSPFEGKLRSLSQQSQNIVFIYSGSEQHLLNEIFNEYSKPFYQSTRLIAISKIESNVYFDFILKQFKKAKKEVSHEIIEYILSLSHQHTYYTQAIANYLYSLEVQPKSVREFELLYRDFILEKSVFYRELPELLTKQQFLVLKAIAKSRLVSNPNSAEFREVSKIKGPSSMQRAINSLLDKQLIIKDNGSIRLYDVFLEHYLKYV